MKKIVVSLFIILLAFVLVGCPFFPPDEPIPEGDEIGNVEFSLDLAYAKTLGYTITQVKVTLTHQTTNETNENYLTINNENSQATGTIRNLRPGTWDIAVELHDASGLLATGTGTVDVVIGTTSTAEIHITLGGDVEVTVTWGDMGPEIGSWTITTSLPTARRGAVGVVYNGYLYLLGGYNSSNGNLNNEVLYATINTDGTLGTWNSTSAFTEGRTSSIVEYNGFLYIVGGASSRYLDDVQYAPLNSDGTVGTWNSTTSISGPRSTHSIVAYNGHLYIIGGWRASAYYRDAQYAPINADGTVGTWNSTTSLSADRMFHTSVVHNGYLYVIGGGISGETFSDILYAPINADGTIGTWNTAGTLSIARTGHRSLVYNGYLYVVGGQDQNTRFDDVQYAPINADGTIGTWNIGTSFSTARSTPACVVHNGYLYVIGGRSETGGEIDDVQFTRFE